MRFLIPLFITCFVLQLSAQKIAPLDSIALQLNTGSDREKINSIVDIPFDVAVSDIKQFEALADTSILLSKKINDKLLLAKSLEKKALALHFTKNTDKAVAINLEAIRLYEQLKLKDKAGKSYAELGWKIKYLDYDKAFGYVTKAIKLLDESEDKSELNVAYDHLGVLFGMKKQWDSAVVYHSKSLKLKKSLKDSIGIPFGYSHLANVYLKTQRYDLAQRYLDSSLQIRVNRNDIYGITDTYLYLGDLNFEKKTYKKAIDYYNKAYKLSNEQSYYPLKKYATEYLFKSYNALGDSKKALDYHLQYIKQKDSVLNIETNNRINQLEIEFQTEKKEKEILQQRANIADKELKLSKKNTYILGLTTLVVMTLLLGYLIYNQQRLKNNQLKKENELKGALLKIETQHRLQEQRLRISRDLHDNIGAQLTFIISSLDNLKYGFKLPKKLSAKLNYIGEFTTSTISELRDTIWAMNKNEITFEDLQSRILNFIEKADFTALDIKFSFNCDDSVDTSRTFSSVEGMNIYRIIQEAINNAIKYSETKTITVNIKQEESCLCFEIIDEGIGFNKDKITYGNGFNNMAKRAEEINAALTVNSEISKGTQIIIVL